MPRSEITGAELDTNGEEWRHECEARWVLAMDGRAARNAYLDGTYDSFGKVLKKGIKHTRGDAEVQRIRTTVYALIEARKTRAAANQAQQTLAA